MNPTRSYFFTIFNVE